MELKYHSLLKGFQNSATFLLMLQIKALLFKTQLLVLTTPTMKMEGAFQSWSVFQRYCMLG